MRCVVLGMLLAMSKPVMILAWFRYRRRWMVLAASALPREDMSQPFRPYPTPGDYGQRWGEGAYSMRDSA
eukprot:5613667-Amphidinium_carterae.1